MLSKKKKVKTSKSQIERFVVQKVKERRKKMKINQHLISIMLGLSKGFVGQAESPNSRTKYSIDQLDKLAHHLDCSIADFFPEKPFYTAPPPKPGEELDWNDYDTTKV